MWLDLAEWARTRLLRARLAALWLLVTGAVMASGAGLARLPEFAGLTALWIASFRLWDDLADRPYDRVYHPERIAVRSRAAPLWFAHVTAGMVCSALMLWDLRGMAPVIFLGLLSAGFVLVYLLFPSLGSPSLVRGAARSGSRTLRALLVLSKYPAFVWLLAPERSGRRALFVGALLYALLAVHEVRSERLNTLSLGEKKHEI
jgi:hypothetical protein